MTNELPEGHVAREKAHSAAPNGGDQWNAPELSAQRVPGGCDHERYEDLELKRTFGQEKLVCL